MPETDGWTIFPARLSIEDCTWRATAEHDDGRLLWAEVPAPAGPEMAESGVRAMLAVHAD